MRVRAANASGRACGSRVGTPALGPKYGFAPTSSPPGVSPDLEVVLSEAAPGRPEADAGADAGHETLAVGACTGAGVTLAEGDDTVRARPRVTWWGATTASVEYPTADNGDDLVLGSECFALRLSTTVEGWNPGDAVAKVSIQQNTGRIAFGNSAVATAKLTRTVAENVGGGTLDVPVTVDYLPAESMTIAVEVLGAGTATEGTDFSIATKSVTFGPSTAKTQNVTVTITDDTEVEGGETIELRIAAAQNTDPLINRQYSRHAQGALAAVTITSEDAVPGAVRDLEVSADSAKLDLSWRAPSSAGSSAIAGYDVHYTSSSTVADDAAVGTAVATQWVAVSRTGTGTTQEIGTLANETAYRVRVRAANASGSGAWVHGSGTPAATPSVSLSAPDTVAEGGRRSRRRCRGRTTRP